ncbi:MAG TPA: hypothetical protein VK698_37130 [Kofleriaceae bacterium]|nr:hypothetical protein [Kofleriaceae bacterium]
MGKRPTRDKADSYLQQYPELERWINRCVSCHAAGHRPDLPEKFDAATLAPRNLRRYFGPLALDEHGRCDACAHAGG